jgi:restriction system protein
LSVQTTKEAFMEIELENVNPKLCFKNLKGVSAAKLIDIAPILPILSMNRDDKRFVVSKDVNVDNETNLASMDWEDFEHLVRQLFEQEFSTNGGEVRVTQASRDGGVDAIVFDSDPLRGGKIVIQAKRYTKTVGVAAVRDLYGTLINEGANSGILITTSDYGSDSYAFAKDKPIKLLNGGHLLGLLEKHGHKARINIEEARNAFNR